MSKRIYASCLFATVIAVTSLRWLCDLVAPWSVGDDLSIPYTLCCLAATPVVALGAIVCFLAWIIKANPNLERTSSQGVGLALLGAFVFFSLPLIGILATPIQAPGDRGPLDQDCEWVRESTLHYSSMHPSRYAETTNTWLDIDGDGEQERWEQIDAKSGGIGFDCAVFIYEKNELTPRWCGKVGAGESFLVAWVRPINLDLDLTPEIWMRDAVFLPTTYSFLDFSANEVREFDPRLQILLVLLPIRVVPLLIWLRFRNKPVPSIVIAAVTTLAYAVFS